MKDSKEHLNIELNFLDKEEHVRAVSKARTEKSGGVSGNSKRKPIKTTTGVKYNWNVIVIVGVVILFIGGIIFSENTPTSTHSNTNYSSTNTNTFRNENGESFRCSDYHYDHAMILQPSASESITLDARIRAIEIESQQIDNMYVNRYSQSSVRQYNTAVDNFNYKNNKLQTDIAIWNRNVDAFNSYLDNNCRSI